MPQFRPFPPFQAFDDCNQPDVAGEQAEEQGRRPEWQGLPAGVSQMAPPLTGNIPLATGGSLRHPAALAAMVGCEEEPMAGQVSAPPEGAGTTGALPGERTTTGRLVALTRQSRTTGDLANLTNLTDVLAALQTTAQTTRRMVVIPAERKKSPSRPGARRLSARQRQGTIIGVLVMAILVTLLTLSPLAGGNGVSILGGIRQWIQDQQNAWQIAAHQQSLNLADFNQPNLPPMTIPNSPYVAVAEQAAINAGISPIYFVRQINVESGFNPNAVSPAGAVGIAQFLPSTAAGLGIDPWNPIEALQGAARLMASYTHSYGDYAKALAAYNAGSGALQAALNSCGSAWLSCVPAETQNYIYRIMGI
jgi:hypothetical protein